MHLLGYGEAVVDPTNDFLAFCCPAPPWSLGLLAPPMQTSTGKEAWLPAEEGAYRAVWLATLCVMFFFYDCPCSFTGWPKSIETSAFS